MTDNDATPVEPGEDTSPAPKSAEQPEASTAAEQPKPRPAKRGSQPILVWLGIGCLLVAVFVGWKVSDRKKWFQPVANRLNDPLIREGQVLQEWSAKLRETGGPMCNAIADMLTEQKLSPLLKERGVTNFEELSIAVAETGPLYPICERELTRNWSMAAWILALGGIGLIVLDVLRERGMLGGKK